MSQKDIQAINACLPQTQCKQCHYDGCLPYAEAIINNKEATHLCRPGGLSTYKKIHTLLNQPTSQSQLNVIATYEINKHSVGINNDQCIGCTKCISACPVDAIVGASKTMHFVIEDLCTGCDLCIPTCPVDCITTKPHTNYPAKDTLIQYFDRKKIRLQKQEQQTHNAQDTAIHTIETKHDDIIMKALARARAKRQHHEPAT